MKSDDYLEHRLDEIKSIRKQYKNFYEIAGGLVIVVILIIAGLLIFSADRFGFWQNVYITLVGTALTIFVIDKRAEQRLIHQRKEELILQMGSRNVDFAREAVRIMRQKGWLNDGSLDGAFLNVSNFQNVNLWSARMRNANFWHANFEGANLQDSDLNGSNFQMANLRDVDMRGANLSSTIFYVNAEMADTEGADFRGANLCDAKVLDMQLAKVQLDENTILPSGEKYKFNQHKLSSEIQNSSLGMEENESLPVCPYCQRKFIGLDELTLHIITRHSQNPSPSRPNR